MTAEQCIISAKSCLNVSTEWHKRMHNNYSYMFIIKKLRNNMQTNKI